jgi:predicted ester cyclase
MEAVSDGRRVIEELVSTINAHDLAAGRALYDREVRAVTATGRHLDLNGLDALLAASFDAFPDLRVEVQRWIVDGDVVVTEEVMEGTHLGPFAGLAPTGRRVRLGMAHVNRVIGGRIVERVAYHDTAGILRQLDDQSS